MFHAGPIPECDGCKPDNLRIPISVGIRMPNLLGSTTQVKLPITSQASHIVRISHSPLSQFHPMPLPRSTNLSPLVALLHPGSRR